MQNIKVSNISIVPVRPTPKGLLAFCNFTINNIFHIGNVAIYSCLNGEKEYRLVYPERKIKTGATVTSFCPIDRDVGDKIEQTIIDKFKGIINK